MVRARVSGYFMLKCKPHFLFKWESKIVGGLNGWFLSSFIIQILYFLQIYKTLPVKQCEKAEIGKGQ